jgi:hypothetical protein
MGSTRVLNGNSRHSNDTPGRSNCESYRDPIVLIEDWVRCSTYCFIDPFSHSIIPRYVYCDVRCMISPVGVIQCCCMIASLDAYIINTSVLPFLQLIVNLHFLQKAYMILMLFCTPSASSLMVAKSSAYAQDVTLYGCIIVPCD